MFSQYKQHGMSMTGFLLVICVVGFFGVVAMKIIPAYTEFLTIKKIIKIVAEGPDTGGMSNSDLREAYGKRASIDNISTVKPSDLNIKRENGKAVISVEYTFITPLMGNVSIMLDFKASSGADSQAAE